jgi:hypothetical protein
MHTLEDLPEGRVTWRLGTGSIGPFAGSTFAMTMTC